MDDSLRVDGYTVYSYRTSFTAYSGGRSYGESDSGVFEFNKKALSIGESFYAPIWLEVGGAMVGVSFLIDCNIFSSSEDINQPFLVSYWSIGVGSIDVNSCKDVAYQTIDTLIDYVRIERQG